MNNQHVLNIFIIIMFGICTIGSIIGVFNKINSTEEMESIDWILILGIAVVTFITGYSVLS